MLTKKQLKEEVVMLGKELERAKGQENWPEVHHISIQKETLEFVLNWEEYL